MASHIQRILRAVEKSPWAIQPDKLETIAAVLVAKAQSGQIPSAAEIKAQDEAPQPGVQSTGNITVLPMFGTMARRMGMLSAMSGGLSLERFGARFDAAVNDDGIGTIVLQVDSPGGSVYGVEEIARKIFGARGQKRIIAVVDPLAASGAYWIGAAAEEFVITPSGEAGSIGVFAIHFDWSAALEAEGIQATIIRAGDKKAEGNPYEPLDDDALSYMQSQVDDYYDLFVRAVAKYRGVSVSDVRGEQFGQGRTFTAKRAVDAGLADRIASIDEVLSDLKSNRRRRMSSARAEQNDLQLAASVADRPWRRSLVAGDGTVSSAFVRGAMDHGSFVIVTTAETESEPPLAPDPEDEHEDDSDEETEEQPSAEAEGAADAEPENPPTTTAPEASEEAMPEKVQDTAARNGAVTAEEKQRRAELRALGREYDDIIDTAQVDAWIDDDVSVQVARSEMFLRLQKKDKARAKVVSPGDTPRVGKTRSEGDPKRGFRSHREFLESAIENAGSDEQGGYADSVGGFARQPVLLPGMMQVGMEGDPTAGRTQDVPMTAPMVDILARVDKDHRTSVSGGFVVTRKPETTEGKSSRMNMERVSLRATSLFGLAFATEEILVDSPVSFVAIIDGGFRDQFAFHMLNEKLRGKGGGEYLGVLESTAKVEVDAEQGQTENTIVADNVINMRSRCWGYGRAIWLANHDTYPQLIKLAVVVSDGAGAGGLVLIYQSSSREDRPDMLLGRPIFYTEHASSVGHVGDLVLADWSQYLEGLYQPLMSAESVHVRFVNHERAFKFWLRNAGAPWWRHSLIPHKSAQTLSPIVTLAPRLP